MHLLWEIMGGGPPKVALRLGINIKQSLYFSICGIIDCTIPHIV